jgi:hypothetical protein
MFISNLKLHQSSLLEHGFHLYIITSGKCPLKFNGKWFISYLYCYISLPFLYPILTFTSFAPFSLRFKLGKTWTTVATLFRCFRRPCFTITVVKDTWWYSTYKQIVINKRCYISRLPTTADSKTDCFYLFVSLFTSFVQYGTDRAQ